MAILKYFLFGLMCFLINNVFANDNLIKIDSVCSGYFVDESTPLPFSPVLGLKFGIPDTAFVIVEVHKIENNERNNSVIESKKIKTILHEKLSIGMYLINWDGTDSEGKIQSKSDHLYLLYKNREKDSYSLW